MTDYHSRIRELEMYVKNLDEYLNLSAFKGVSKVTFYINLRLKYLNEIAEIKEEHPEYLL